MCTIKSMRRKGCRTVCSPWSWNGTRINRSSNKVLNCESSDLISDYKNLLIIMTGGSKKKNKRHCPNAVLMVNNCLRRWPSIKTTKSRICCSANTRLFPILVNSIGAMSRIFCTAVRHNYQQRKHWEETLKQCWLNVTLRQRPNINPAQDQLQKRGRKLKIMIVARKYNYR